MPCGYLDGEVYKFGVVIYFMEKDCVFCKIISGEVGSEKLFESENFIGILDISPVSEGHTLIIPKEHYATILDMPDEFGNELIGLVKKRGGEWVSQKEGNGFNFLQSNFKSAQQDVEHLHFHIVPRSKGDGIRYRYRD